MRPAIANIAQYHRLDSAVSARVFSGIFVTSGPEARTKAEVGVATAVDAAAASAIGVAVIAALTSESWITLST